MPEIKALIIGAGAAGLAVAACLKKAGISNLILEQSDQVGATWRKHYDRLHLHTDKQNSALPFMPFPKEYPRYPARDQLIQYLEDYAQAFDLDIRFQQKVQTVQQESGQWLVQTQDKLHAAPNLVIATGNTRQPLKPVWPGLESFPGPVLHSSEYKNGQPFRGQRVLVVGFGNSGGEIAIDLFEHGAKPSLAVRGAVNVIPRDLAGLPILSIGILQSKMPAWLADGLNAPILRMAVGDITQYGLRKLPYGPVAQIRNTKRIPLIDVGTMRLIRAGQIMVRPAVEQSMGNRIRFKGGAEADFEALILATGYQPNVSEFLVGAESVLGADGTPNSTGRESALAGLYFCGYYVSPTGMLREIAIEAQQIGAALAKKTAY